MIFQEVTLGLNGVVAGYLPVSNAIDEVEYTLTGTAPELDPDLGTIQVWTLEGNSAPVDTLTSGQSMALLIIDNGSAYTITWPSVIWSDDEAPELNSGGGIVVTLWKSGTKLYGRYRGKVPAPVDLDYAGLVQSSNPYLWWRFAEPSGTTVVDSSGNNRTGTYGASITLGASSPLPGDSAVTIAPAGGARITSGVSGVGSSQTALSGEIIFSTTAASNSYQYLLGNLITGQYPVWGLHLNTNAFLLQLFTGNTEPTFGLWTPSTISYADGLKHQIGFSWNAYGDTKIRLFFDGQKVATSEAASGTLWAGNGHVFQVLQLGNSEAININEISVANAGWEDSVFGNRWALIP